MMHAPLEELDGFLAAHPETEWFTLIVSDINGVARGKVVRRHEMEAVYRYGRPLPSSILSLDIKGEDVPETGLVWDIGDMDCRAFPVAGSLKPCPWLEGTAQVLISFGTDCGLPMEPPDPRLKLQQVTDRFKANGMVPVVAIELEFYLLDKSAFAERGELVPARLQNGMPNEQTQVYGVAELEAMRPFFDDIYHFADMQDLPAETAISEYAPGQFEITLRHRANALQAADEAIAFKRLIKAVADRHGMLASFMAKPFSGLAGCGMHIHASIEDDGGRNLFAADAPEGSPLLGQAIAGMRDTAADGPWAFRFAEPAVRRTVLPAPSVYYDRLKPHAARIDIWHTIYNHPMADHGAIVEWVKGSGLRPWLDRAGPDHRDGFLAAYRRRIEEAYPVLAGGGVLFRFPRLFIVAAR